MIFIKNDGIIPDKIVFLKFALKAKRTQARQYDVDFGIERFSCRSIDEITQKEMILKSNLNAAFRSECYKKDDVGAEYQAIPDKVFAELLNLVGVITLIDKKTGNRLEISYQTNAEAVLLHGHKTLSFLYSSEIRGKDYSINKAEQRKYLSSFLKKITYEFLPETTEDKNKTKFAATNVLINKLPSVLGRHVGTFLTKKEGACLTATCATKYENESKSTAQSCAVKSLIVKSRAGTTAVSSHQIIEQPVSALYTTPRMRCLIM